MGKTDAQLQENCVISSFGISGYLIIVKKKQAPIFFDFLQLICDKE